MAQDPDVDRACQKLELCAPTAGHVHLSEVKSWFRAGAETFAYVFAVEAAGVERQFILKAMASATPGIPPERQLAQRLGRRQLLIRADGAVPRLFGSGNASYIEELIPHDLYDIVNTDSLAETLQYSVASLLAAIVRCRFQPLSLLPNIMARSDKVFWVDFGSDLGEPGIVEVDMETTARRFIIECRRASQGTYRPMRIIEMVARL